MVNEILKADIPDDWMLDLLEVGNAYQKDIT